MYHLNFQEDTLSYITCRRFWLSKSTKQWNYLVLSFTS